MKNEKTVCSLCEHEVEEKHLHRHGQTEAKEIIEYTINMIKSRHPSWVAEIGVCEKCWEYYRSL